MVRTQKVKPDAAVGSHGFSSTHGAKDPVTESSPQTNRALWCHEIRALGKDPPDRRGVLDIIRDGAGADRQVDHFRLRRLEGDSESEALRSVVDLVVAETKEAGPRRDTPLCRSYWWWMKKGVTGRIHVPSCVRRCQSGPSAEM